ncbi:MAG: sigma factor-like helix-turn-helix DNA-binding protein [Candidatus Woesearchaeota archaeon]
MDFNEQFNNNIDQTIDIFYNHLIATMECLTDREAKILALRYGLVDGKSYTLKETGDIFGISRERIRQLLNKITRKIKKEALFQFNKNNLQGGCYKFVYCP